MKPRTSEKLGTVEEPFYLSTYKVDQRAGDHIQIERSGEFNKGMNSRLSH